MMFWAVNLKPFPCLPRGVSLFGYPTSHRCPQSQMQHRQTARRMIWFSCKGFCREKRDRKAQFPFPPLPPWPTPSPENTNQRTARSGPTTHTAHMEQGKVRGDEHPTLPAPHSSQQQQGPKWVFKEGTASPEMVPPPAAAHLCDGWACAKGARLAVFLLSQHSCSCSSGRAQRHSLTPLLHSGPVVIFHSIAAFAACHLLTWWSFINVASHPPLLQSASLESSICPSSAIKKSFPPFSVGKESVVSAKGHIS